MTPGRSRSLVLSSKLLLALYQGFVNYCSASFTTSPTIIWRSRLNERLVRQLAARLQWQRLRWLRCLGVAVKWSHYGSSLSRKSQSLSSISRHDLECQLGPPIFCIQCLARPAFMFLLATSGVSSILVKHIMHSCSGVGTIAAFTPRLPLPPQSSQQCLLLQLQEQPQDALQRIREVSVAGKNVYVWVCAL